MQIPRHIFKAYDIRGLVATELSEDLAYRLGKALVIFLNKKGGEAPLNLVVGRDMRPSSPSLQEALIKGITEAGVNVVDIGMVSTPLFNFACANYSDHSAGVMVTASHNPAEYNGFKITLGNGLPIGKNSGMDEIADLVLSDSGVEVKQMGTVTQKSVLNDYIDHIFALVPKDSIAPLKIVIDCGNGMADVTFPSLLRSLPITVTYLYREPDGTFPNHEANPLKTETLKDLSEEVKKQKADFGFALDGDADRIGLVDEHGEVVDASYVGAILGLEVLKKYKSGLMLYDLRSSNIVRESWEAEGAKTDMCMVGHALIKNVMKKNNAIFASELSLHLYYKDMFDLESGDLSLLYLLALVSREKKSLSEILRPFKKYYHSGEINFEVDDKDGAIKKLEEKFSEEMTSRSDIDGLRLDFADWWFSVRKSNTEPVLRLNLEAKTPDLRDKMLAEIRAVVTD